MIAMTTEPTYADDDPHQLLVNSRHLASQVRRAQRGTWIPLVVFALVTFGAIPVDRWSHYSLTCRTAAPHGVNGVEAKVCAVYATAGFVYWPIALVLAYVAVAALYVRRSRERGLGTRVRPYVVAGIVLAALATAVSISSALHPRFGAPTFLGLRLGTQPDAFYHLIGPASAIGLALLVLAWLERSLSLLALTLVYLATVIHPLDAGHIVHHLSPWTFLPNLLVHGGVLLLGGIGFAIAERAARTHDA
jgi:hypothetical protein